MNLFKVKIGLKQTIFPINNDIIIFKNGSNILDNLGKKYIWKYNKKG